MLKNIVTWENRRILTDNPATSPETYQRIGRELLDLDLCYEATEFFARGGDDQGLRKIMSRAVEGGDFFVYRGALTRLRDKNPVYDDIIKLRDNAEKGGKILYAAKAAAYIEEKIKPTLDTGLDR
ncbi:MAG: hypothetical protein AMR96_06470 [Candidatus Adiutrix intracellularis]|jgi:hypothetical protein|nr:MAG: hypothetical protein AMR96_06470 [Candidatus Adiutrix intracellularis]MDR2826465.1 hypothetical protein [Candidatus Adiutrix intracellularis]